MKQITCEMCGGTDLVKQDGVFVCQSCGCKYSVEEARKMMVDGTVDVSGSKVKIDSSDELANLYHIARRARDDNNSENAAKYYDLILVKDPFSWEAAFYVVYFKAMECKIAQIRSAAISVSNCEDSVLSLVRDYVPEEEQALAVAEIAMRCSLIAATLETGAKNAYYDISQDIRANYTQELVNRVCDARDIAYNCGTQIEKIFGEKPEIARIATVAWKSGIDIHTNLLPFLSNTASNKQTILSYARKIEKHDPVLAKPYILSITREQLQPEIKRLKDTISTTRTEPISENEGKCGLIFMLFMVLVTWFFFVIGFRLGGVVFILCDIVSFSLVIYGMSPITDEELNVNRNKVANAKAELKKIEELLSGESLEVNASYAEVLTDGGHKKVYDVVLTNCGTDKIRVIREIQALLGLGLAEAKCMAESVSTIKAGLPKEDAEKIKSKLESFGATVELR